MLDSIETIIASIPNQDDRTCFEAGYDCEMNGANTTNCHFSLFSSREHTRAWEEGKRAAREEKAAQHCVEPSADHAPKTGTTRKPSTRKAGASRKTRVGSR